MKRLLAVIFLGAANLFASASGTDILHYNVTKGTANDGVEPGAIGVVQARQNKQGAADNQQLNIFLTGLTTNGTYEILANGDTNLSDGVSFTTDANGKAELEYRSQGNGKGQGPGKTQLPAVLNPVSDISQLDIFNTSTQAVLTAEMTMPNRLQYLVKRNLSTNNVDAILRIQATTARTRFDLKASGLNAANDYLLVVNDSVVQTNTTNSKGKLNITTLPVSGSILSVTSLQLWDASSNLVLTTTLP